MNTDSAHQALEHRLVELETRLSFQERALIELSDALAQSRLEAYQQSEMLKRVVEELKTVRTSLYADAGSEPPPPHY
jgi:SlyX protein